MENLRMKSKSKDVDKLGTRLGVGERRMSWARLMQIKVASSQLWWPAKWCLHLFGWGCTPSGVVLLYKWQWFLFLKFVFQNSVWWHCALLLSKFNVFVFSFILYFSKWKTVFENNNQLSCLSFVLSPFLLKHSDENPFRRIFHLLCSVGQLEFKIILIWLFSLSVVSVFLSTWIW